MAGNESQLRQDEFAELTERFYQLTPEEEAQRAHNESVERPLRPTDRAAGLVGNRVMSGLAGASAGMVLVTLAAVAGFLLYLAMPALTANDLQLRPMGSPERVGLWQFTAPQIFGTALAAFIALALAMPLALGVGVALTQYLPARLAAPLGYLVDLLAAVPSVVFGLWGALFLLPLIQPLQVGANKYLGWIPFFAGTPSPTGRTILSAGVVLAVMILPVITAVVREIMASAPRDQVEGALGLGATRWEVTKLVVFPHARSGIISAAMLGLGRALGETMAVVMVLSVGSSMTWSVIEAGKHSTIAANIALQFPESYGIETSALVATGLALFAITLVVNTVARIIVSKGNK